MTKFKHTPKLQPETGGRSSRWGQDRRLEFIDFRLMWEGRINRSEISEHFGVSIQQASMDLSRYMSIAPQNVLYDRSEKVYKNTSEFRPAVIGSDSLSYLTQLHSLAAGSLPPASSFIGWRPSHDILRIPTRRIRPAHLVAILRAIRERLELEVSYQSLREAKVVKRWIAPHAIAFDGQRWHVRAWCHRHNEFRDFTVTRFQQIHESRTTTIDSNSDHTWHTISVAILRPRSELSPSQREAIELEYGMDKGELRISLRRAMIFYFAKEIQLLPDQSMSTRAQPLEWANAEEFADLLSTFRK